MALEFRGIHASILDDESPEIDIEGARYSGKSWLGCVKVIRACLKYPGLRAHVGRYTDQDTDKLLRPVFVDMLRREGISGAEWSSNDAAYHFTAQAEALRSTVSMHGLRAQTTDLELSKVRGLDKGLIWNDQSEELKQKISEELRFSTRQPGNFPRQLIFSPNPCTEDHYLTDQFPDECLVGGDASSANRFPHRRYYRLSIYDNGHNLPPGKIAEIEAMYPPTHARHKALVLGLRGVNVVGVPCHSAFDRAVHLRPLVYDETAPIFESIQHGQHHPTWLAAQRGYRGGLKVLAAVMGKRMSLDEFLPIVREYRADWFADARFRTCTDPPPDAGMIRFTNISILRDHGFTPTWRPQSNAPDVREAIIQAMTRMMRRPIHEGFALSDEPTRFLMISHDIRKPSKFLLDGMESAYVWDEHLVSVGNKRVRVPKPDEWIEGAQRCLENIALNFCADRKSDFDRDRDTKENQAADAEPTRRVSVWA